MIISETSLSFLGLGLRPPAMSWGVLLQQAQNIQALAISPWLLIPSIPVTIVILPLIVNGTFYLELALGQTIAWVDARLTLRWESIVYLVSAALALGWLALVHATIPGGPRALLVGTLAIATAGSLHVLRLGVRADELQLIQRLAQVIAAELTLSHSFQKVQELTRQLVPWEQMGFARYDARTRQMELVADTAAPPGGGTAFRFDSDAGLTGEALRLRRPVVAVELQEEVLVALPVDSEAVPEAARSVLAPEAEVRRSARRGRGRRTRSGRHAGRRAPTPPGRARGAWNKARPGRSR